jgi:hypothetical protein
VNAFALSWLADVLRSTGLTVNETDGWKTRGHGDVGKIKGVLCHHTAGPLGHGDAPSLAVVRDGRPDLPGPLAQLVLGRSGTFYVVAAGRAYHAGKGSWPSVGTDNGNEHLIGIEAENTGLENEPWPQVQLMAYARGAAAVLKHVGAPASMCLGHKEWAPGRKSDPSFDMLTFRAATAAQMAQLP